MKTRAPVRARSPRLRNALILGLAAGMVALPFVLRRTALHRTRTGGMPLVIVSPHNEAIRREFEQAFSQWHQARYGQPVSIDWRNVGGATEIMRYLASEFANSAGVWWRSRSHTWSGRSAEAVSAEKPIGDPELDALRSAVRDTDDPKAFTSGIDLLFGGGEYDHAKAYLQGLTVAPWPPGHEPANLFTNAAGMTMIPEKLGGESWRSATYFGNAASTFGICYNADRLRDLGIDKAPAAWDDLADPRLFRQVGVADPTKSGSIAKAFELIVHQKCRQRVAAAGFDDARVDAYEKAIRAATGAPPANIPPAYQQAIERGWLDGLGLVQRICANGRYFSDSASRVPIDVASGNAAAGLAIDFYSRFEAQNSRDRNGRERMTYVVPDGGTSAAIDPISLLRGAPHRETAVRFIEFVLSEEGQRLWCYKPGEPGGPVQFALRRVPVRRDFFPCATNAAVQAAHELHRRHAADDLADPQVDPYEVAARFAYRPRWTLRHFGVLRDLVRAMCIDSMDELQAAWGAIIALPDGEVKRTLLARLSDMPDRPEPLTWVNAPDQTYKHDRMECLRTWTQFFRSNYLGIARDAQRAAERMAP